MRGMSVFGCGRKKKKKKKGEERERDLSGLSALKRRTIFPFARTQIVSLRIGLTGNVSLWT